MRDGGGTSHTLILSEFGVIFFISERSLSPKPIRCKKYNNNNNNNNFTVPLNRVEPPDSTILE